jgi:hypothetical protein
LYAWMPPGRRVSGTTVSPDRRTGRRWMRGSPVGGAATRSSSGTPCARASGSSSSSVGRRWPLSRRDSVLTEMPVASASAARVGVDAVTIRRVAQAYGLSPMGLYRHVRDKDDLLDRVVDAVVGPGLQDLQASGPWDQQVADLFRSLRRLFLDHPGVAALCVLRPTPVLGVARFYARMLAVLAAGGFTGTGAVQAFDTLGSWSYPAGISR